MDLVGLLSDPFVLNIIEIDLQTAAILIGMGLA
jgi:hypothetical protein